MLIITLASLLGTVNGASAISEYYFVRNGLLCHNFPVCGRYRLSRRKQIIEDHFDSVSDVSE